MKNLMIKEIRLAASPLSFIFILFSVMALIPGYPILVSAFFICFGIFQSFQSACENNDILYTVLLPIKKTDTVKIKYRFTVLIQMISFIIMVILSLLRMTVMAEVIPYTQNVMMNANQFFLGCTLLVFASFNLFFLGGFFRTGYKYGKPFLYFGIVSFLLMVIAESLHHIPGLEFLNRTDSMKETGMWLFLVITVILYILVTELSCKSAMKNFEAVDM